MFRRDSRALDGLFDDDDDAVSAGRVDPSVQIAGNLYKKATSGRPSWKRRFVVVKDGFLLYYPAMRETAGAGGAAGAAAADSSPSIGRFDFHPKGEHGAPVPRVSRVWCGLQVRMRAWPQRRGPLFADPAGLLPLDGTAVDKVDDGPTRALRNSFAVSHPSFGGRALVLCADTEAERDRWMTAVESCRFITYENAVAGSQQIAKLKQQQQQARIRTANAEEEARAATDDAAAQSDDAAALRSAADKLFARCRALERALTAAGGDPSSAPFAAEMDLLAGLVGVGQTRRGSTIFASATEAGVPARQSVTFTTAAAEPEKPAAAASALPAAPPTLPLPPATTMQPPTAPLPLAPPPPPPAATQSPAAAPAPSASGTASDALRLPPPPPQAQARPPAEQPAEGQPLPPPPPPPAQEAQQAERRARVARLAGRPVDKP